MLKRHMNAGDNFILVTHDGLRLWIKRNDQGHADVVVEHQGEKLTVSLGREKKDGQIQYFATFDGPLSYVVTPSQHLFHQRGGGQDGRPGKQQVAEGNGTAATTLQPKRKS